MHTQTIAIIVAMESEARILAQRLELLPSDNAYPNLPFRIYRGQHQGVDVILSHNGKCPRFNVDHIGSQAAVLNTQHVIQTYQPDLIVSAGTAGGVFAKGARIGDVYASTGPIKFHDRRYPIPGFKEYGVGAYQSKESPLLQSFMNLAVCQLGIISSGDSLYMSAEETTQFRDNEAVAKDMEAAAVAWVASVYDTPFVAIKAITDLVDVDSQIEAQFQQNFTAAMRALAEKVALWRSLDLS